MIFKKFLFTLFLYVITSCCLLAQPGSAPGDPGGDPDAVPVGGIEILIVAGAALGIRSILKSKKDH